MKTEIIIVRVSPDFKKELEDRATHLQMGYGAYVRMAVKNEITKSKENEKQ